MRRNKLCVWIDIQTNFCFCGVKDVFLLKFLRSVIVLGVICEHDYVVSLIIVRTVSHHLCGKT